MNPRHLDLGHHLLSTQNKTYCLNDIQWLRSVAVLLGLEDIVQRFQMFTMALAKTVKQSKKSMLTINWTKHSFPNENWPKHKLLKWVLNRNLQTHLRQVAFRTSLEFKILTDPRPPHHHQTAYPRIISESTANYKVFVSSKVWGHEENTSLTIWLDCNLTYCNLLNTAVEWFKIVGLK